MICYFIVEFNRSADTNINSFDKLYSQIGYVFERFDIEIAFEKTKRDYGIAGLMTVPSELSKGQFDAISYSLDRIAEDPRILDIIKVDSCKLCPFVRNIDNDVYCIGGIRINSQIDDLDKIDDHCPLLNKIDEISELLEDIEYSLGTEVTGVDIDSILKDSKRLRELLKIPESFDGSYCPEED